MIYPIEEFQQQCTCQPKHNQFFQNMCHDDSETGIIKPTLQCVKRTAETHRAVT
jgi:hypothetical protein